MCACHSCLCRREGGRAISVSPPFHLSRGPFVSNLFSSSSSSRIGEAGALEWRAVKRQAEESAIRREREKGFPMVSALLFVVFPLPYSWASQIDHFNPSWCMGKVRKRKRSL
jgi:hypothetical protein